ncbi:MAG: rhodanese-like domain-containing protein [Bacteroidales bacterium]|nr:rhodanese-like domain-containing protein [Bacteroidales bacterium]
MKPRIVLAAFIIPLGLIIAAIPQNTTVPYKLTAHQLLAESNLRSKYVSPEQVAHMLVSKDPTLQLIDVRSQDEYDKYHLEGAVNIPITDLLAEKYAYLINQEVKMNVFYSNGTVVANEAWMITRQLGYNNNYILEGGLNYWAETILNPIKPANTSPNEEFARYDFRKAAGTALGAAPAETLTAPENSQPATAIPIIVKPKKKKAAGGC